MSTDRDPIWDEMKRHSKEKFNADRAQFLADAEAGDDGGWTKHTDFHWSRSINGERIDYWPSRKKWQYRGRVQRGDVAQFILQNADTRGVGGMTPRWYMITADGYATLCADRLDAEQTARDADAEWPRHGPHRAVQLVESSAIDELRSAAQALVDRWDTPNWKDAPHTGEYIARLRKALASCGGEK